MAFQDQLPSKTMNSPQWLFLPGDPNDEFAESTSVSLTNGSYFDRGHPTCVVLGT